MGAPGPAVVGGARVLYPLGLDAFMPVLDGQTPIVPDDMNDLAQAIEVIQKNLGVGTSQVWKRLGVAIGSGPKGENANVKERLDALLEPDGLLKDIVLVTGESKIHDFDESGTGVEVAFPRPITGSSVGGADAYSAWFQCYVTEAPREGTGSGYSDDLPAHFVIYRRWADRLIVKGRGFDAKPLSPVKDKTVKWACLVLGGTVPGVSVG